jgi:formylglycine-generating enzyme required for sulfatase activity
MSLRLSYVSLAAMLCLAPVLSAQQPKASKLGKAAPAATTAVKPVVAAMKLQFVRIAPGEFTMGAATGPAGEQPPHQVRLTAAFDLGKYEVTQAQWQALMDSNPSHFVGPDRPVDSVSWDDTQEFLKRLNAADPTHHYRLPTEAEWEYAARAGTTGDYPGELDQIAWYYSNANQETHPVGQKRPNPWGLYDTHGNVWEWCQDWYDRNYYATSPAANPPGPAEGVNKVLRGGSWGGNVIYSRSSVRIGFVPSQKNAYYGFRVLREVGKKK